MGGIREDIGERKTRNGDESFVAAVQSAFLIRRSVPLLIREERQRDITRERAEKISKINYQRNICEGTYR